MLYDVDSSFLFFFQGSLKVGTRTTSMKYIQPDERERGVHVSVVTKKMIVLFIL